MAEIRSWLSANHLKLNNDKNEFVLIGKKHLLNRINGDKEIRIGESIIKASPYAKNIGAYLDEELNMKMHVNHIARSAYCHVRSISKIRPNTSKETAETLIHAFITL